MKKEDTSREIKEETSKTTLELLEGNGWVFKNPILLQIAEEAPSAKQADERVKKLFQGLPTVNRIARAVRQITTIRLQKNSSTWKDLSQPAKGYQLSDMFIFPDKPTTRKFRFSKGINFYPLDKDDVGLASHENLPPILKEITDGMTTSISELKDKRSSAKFWESVPGKRDSVNLAKLETVTHHEISGDKVGKFHVYLDNTRKPVDPSAYWVEYYFPGHENSEQPGIEIVGQVIIKKPAQGETYSTIYRKISIAQDFGLYTKNNPSGYRDSIVILLNLGIIPKKGTGCSIGRVFFQRKHYLEKGNNVSAVLNFAYSILPSLKLTPLHNSLQDQLTGIISVDNKYCNIDACVPLIDTKDFQLVTGSLLDQYKKILPYEQGKSLNLSTMFGDFFENPPAEIIQLFQ